MDRKNPRQQPCWFLLLATVFQARADLAQFVPHQGVEQVLVRPGLPPSGVLLRALLGVKLEAPCIFFYSPWQEMAQRDFHFWDARTLDGILYGAAAADRAGQFAKATGNPQDRLAGTLFCWPSNKFRARLEAANGLHGYSTGEAYAPLGALNQIGQIERSLEMVVTPHGSAILSYWYHQATVSKTPESLALDRSPKWRFVADPAGQVFYSYSSTHDTQGPSNMENDVAAIGKPVVAFIGGFLDDLHKNVRSCVNAELRRAFPNHDIRYFTHYQGKELRRMLNGLPSTQPYTPVTLVGHSWGAHEAAWQAVASRQRPVARLVTVDPVGHRVPKLFFQQVRRGAREWINIQAVGGPAWEVSNVVARVGLAYGNAPAPFTDLTIRANVTHVRFVEMLLTRMQDNRTVLERAFADWEPCASIRLKLRDRLPISRSHNIRDFMEQLGILA
eukprot:g66995.t1